MKKVIFISIVGLLVLASGGMSYGYDWLDDNYSNPYGDQYPMGDIPVTPPQPELPLNWPTPLPGVPSDPTPGECPEPNNCPVAVDDAAAATCDAPVTIDVLANDYDIDGDSLSIYGIVQEPSHGTAVISGSQVVYTPDSGFEGIDYFQYKITDGNCCYDKACVTITVTCQPPPNNCPVAVNDTAATTCDTPVTIDVLANDSDADGDNLSIYGIVQGPSHGTAAISGSQVVYTPDSDFDGTDYFKYKITDGSCCDTACVTITVTCEPPPPSDCQQCGPGYGGKGKVYYIEVTYNGMTVDESAEWDAKKGKWDKLSSNTILVFSDGSWTKVHTSCSQPLYLYMEVPVYTGSYKHPGNPIGYGMVTDLIISPCVPDPPSGGGGCSWCSK